MIPTFVQVMTDQQDYTGDVNCACHLKVLHAKPTETSEAVRDRCASESAHKVVS